MKPFAINFLAYAVMLLSMYFGFEVFSALTDTAPLSQGLR